MRQPVGSLSSDALRASPDLREPPAQADKHEAPILEEFRRFAFEPVSRELKHPSRNKEEDRQGPQAWCENQGEEKRNRNDDQGNADGVAHPVDRMLMALAVERDPLTRGSGRIFHKGSQGLRFVE